MNAARCLQGTGELDESVGKSPPEKLTGPRPALLGPAQRRTASREEVRRSLLGSGFFYFKQERY